METKINKKNGAEAKVEVKMTKDEFNEFFENSFRDEAAKVELKGFRKGQAPEEMAKNYVDYDKTFEKAAERAIKSALKKITEENEMSLIDAPKIEVKNIKEGFLFEAELVYLPEVNLGDYKETAKKINEEAKKAIEKIIVEEKEVEEAVNWLLHTREHNHKHDDEEHEREHNPEHKHDEKVDSSASSADPHEAGELTDEIAKSMGNFKTAEELRNSIREGIKAEKTVREADKGRAKIINELSEKIKMDVPEIMIKRMADNLKDDLKASLAGAKMPYEDYVKKHYENEERLEEKLRGQAIKEIKAHLLIDAIMRAENIKPEEKEVEEEMNKIFSTIEPEKRKEMDLSKVYDYSFGRVKNEKVFKFLERI